MELSPYEVKRYVRQIRLPEVGLAGQQRLKASSILIVGAGALGCAALPPLAAAGIGHLSIIDPDSVELHNLHRQLLYRDDDVGHPKVEVLGRRFPQVYTQRTQLTPD